MGRPKKNKAVEAAPEVKSPEPPQLSRFGTIFTDDIARRAIAKQLDQEETDAIVRLYSAVIHSSMPKTCSNCVSDAFFELYNIWKRDQEHFEQLYNCEYRLKAGALLILFGDKIKIKQKIKCWLSYTLSLQSCQNIPIEKHHDLNL